MSAIAPLRLPVPRVLPAAILVAVGAIAAWFLYGKLHYVTDVSVESYTPYWWPRRTGLLLHVAGGTVALVAGLVQLWLGLARRTGALHRALGRVYVASIVVGCAAAFHLVYTMPPGMFAFAAGLFSLAVAWLVTTTMAVVAIRRRDLDQHRDWMIRSYVVTFAFVLFRIGGSWVRPYLTADLGAGYPDGLDIVLSWVTWSVPLVLAEPLIQLRAMRRGPAG